MDPDSCSHFRRSLQPLTQRAMAAKSAMIGGCAWMSWLSTGGRSPNAAFLTHTRYALAEVQHEGAFSTAAANCIGQRHATL